MAKSPKSKTTSEPKAADDGIRRKGTDTPKPKAKPKLGVIPGKGRFVRTDDRKAKPS
jgi:hypothetical protein